MDKSAKKLTSLALGSFCLALVWTTQGYEKPKAVIPTKAPVKKHRHLLTPPPAAMKSEQQLTAFAQEYLEFSPELYRVVMGSEARGITLETSTL